MKKQFQCPQCHYSNWANKQEELVCWKCGYDERWELLRLHRYNTVVHLLAKLGFKSADDLNPPWLW